MIKAGRKYSSLIRSGELLLFSIIIGGINLFFHLDPGFLEGYFNPYLILPLVAAAYYGKYYGFLSLFFSLFVVMLPLPLILKLAHPESWDPQYWARLKQTSLIPLVLTLGGVYLFGIIRDSYTARIKRLKERLKDISRDKGILKKRVKGMDIVGRELEERVSKQQDSLTSLYSSIHELYSLNLSKVLDAILETVQRFVGAAKASIWEHSAESRSLKLAASLGWSADESAAADIPEADTIEGWVFRNNRMFSINLLLQYDNLKKLDTGRNLLTIPIMGGGKVWGILNIREMPFAKYNPYSEKLLQMIVSLADPALGKAIEYESVIRQAEIHPVTGFPSFSHFYSVLEKEIQRMTLQGETLSIVIVELANFEEIAEDFGEEKTYSLLIRVTEVLTKLAHERARLFQYKANNQIAFLIPNLDYDGASLFSLEVLGTLNGENWTIDDVSQPVEAVLGYAALGEKKMTADEMLEIADNLLEMQKV